MKNNDDTTYIKITKGVYKGARGYILKNLNKELTTVNIYLTTSLRHDEFEIVEPHNTRKTRCSDMSGTC